MPKAINPSDLLTEVSKQLQAAGEIEELDKLVQHDRLLMTLNERRNYLPLDNS